MTEKPRFEWIDSYHFGKMNRRQVLKRAAAAGVSASTLSILASSGGMIPGAAAAPAWVQADASGLVTVSDEQQATWSKNFNPLVPGFRSFTTNGIYESLAVFNTATSELVPWLATEWTWAEDNMSVAFTVRDGVVWSDGTPFTAADVAFTFNAYLENEGLASGGARVVAPLLASVEAVDNTVVFTLNEVNTLAVYDIAGQPIVPAHIWGELDDMVTFLNEDPVGTGPFVVGRFDTQVWELHKNESYWQAEKVTVAGLRFPAFPDNDAVILSVLDGAVDWAGAFIPDIDATYVARDPENNHYWFPATGATVHLYLNNTVAPFDDPAVRKAISQSIDRATIVSLAMFDYTHPADSSGLSDAFTSWKNEAYTNADWVNLDVDAANAALDAAGLAKNGDWRTLPDGTALSYDINVVTGWSDWVQSCEIIAQGLAAIGIRAQVAPLDFSTWLDKVNRGDFTISIGWASGGPTPINFYRGILASVTYNEIGTVSNENWHRFKSEEADAAIAAFSATADADEQRGYIDELQRIYSENAPAIPLFPGPQWGEYHTSRFEGFPNADNPYAILSTYDGTRGIVMTTITPKAS